MKLAMIALVLALSVPAPAPIDDGLTPHGWNWYP